MYPNNQRNDFLQKLSTQIINDNQIIVLEDLRVSNMLKNRRLAKVISEVSWAEFRRQIEYKASWYGREIIIAPSNNHDRDINASKNLLSLVR